MKLYNLCGEDREIIYSPYGWRAKLCLLHKGLQFDEEPIRFLEKDKIAHVSPQTIPVLDDGDTSVVDSLAIATYLDEAYPERSLFGSETILAQAPVMNRWIDQTLVIGIVRFVLMDIYKAQDAENKVYFRESREKRFGQSLEEVVADRDNRLEGFRRSLDPLRSILGANDYLSGSAPAWFDQAVFGTFMWPYVISDYALLAEDDPVYAWRERMFDQFGGLPRNVKRAV